MEYELAKQLKEAGFPQREHTSDRAYMFDRGSAVGETVYFPTFEELIEACGPKFGRLEQRDKEEDVPEPYPPNWAFAAHSKTFWGLVSFASTPTEAVARLWLALNRITPSPDQS